MLALVIAESVVVVLLAILVAGLLRSHADILRALHQLGAGVGDPLRPDDEAAYATGTRVPVGTPRRPGSATDLPLRMGPPLPAERAATGVSDLEGVTPSGDARSVRVSGVHHDTLLAFLSSGCATCAGVWAELSEPGAAGLPIDVRVVAVTKGPELEIAGEVARRASPGLVVVMSTAAWGDYEVPGSPFFVLVDGPGGRRLGEGVATSLTQVAELVRRARLDAGPPSGGDRQPGGRPGAPPAGQSTSPAFAAGLDGKAREQANDAALLAAGVRPGDPSLYPAALEDLFEPGAGS